jgi:hypothetical protein
MRPIGTSEKPNNGGMIAGLIDSRNQIVRVTRIDCPWAPPIRKLPHQSYVVFLAYRVFQVALCAEFPV